MEMDNAVGIVGSHMFPGAFPIFWYRIVIPRPAV
jgi:hypothetical protein